MRELDMKAVCRLFRNADALLIGAGAGLTSAAGLDYAGEDFRIKFKDYIDKYGFSDLYSSGFYDFPTVEERWTYWARHVEFSRYAPPALPLYQKLWELAKDKNYFVITTNVDGQFYKAGFNPDRIFAVQGDYAEMQCARACHPGVYSNEAAVKNILAHRRGMTTDPEYLPRCPVCGGPAAMHLRVDEFFVEDDKWRKMAANYENFLRKYGSGRIFLLELGAGFNTPSIIRHPFEEIVRLNPEACLMRVNRDQAFLESKAAGAFIPFMEDASLVIEQMLRCD